MDVAEGSIQVPECPETPDNIETRIRQAMDELIHFVRCDGDDLRLMDLERLLWSRIALLFRLCVALFLAERRQRGNPAEPGPGTSNGIIETGRQQGTHVGCEGQRSDRIAVSA